MSIQLHEKPKLTVKTYFSDFFEVEPQFIEKYGSFNISLLNDIPLFIDPFLLFNSKKPEYINLHKNIIDYLLFLKFISAQDLSKGEIAYFFKFPEVKETWFGYSQNGNSGSGLGEKFANALTKSFRNYLQNFGREEDTKTHLEKVCLFDTGIGKDNISDFTTNLIVGYLAEYTEEFANKNLKSNFVAKFTIEKFSFNYTTQSWVSKEFSLPYIINTKGNKEYVLLTPKNILTKGNPWINNEDKLCQFDTVLNSISDEQIRAKINRHFDSILKKDENGDSTKKDQKEAKILTYQEYPILVDQFIKIKENGGEKAISDSNKLVVQTKSLLVDFAKEIVDKLQKETNFYNQKNDSFEDSHRRLLYFKDCIENGGSWRLFHNKLREITNESELQLLFKFTQIDSIFDYNAEPNNGTGPVDFTSSKGSKDKTIIEFKLARNSKFKKNSHSFGQVRAYEKSNRTKKSIKVWFCFNKKEVQKVEKYIKDQKLDERQIIIINCSSKVSASNIEPYKFDEWDIKEMAALAFEELNLDLPDLNLDI